MIPLLLLLLFAALAPAQKVVSARAGLLYSVDGAVTLDGKRIRGISPNDYPMMDEGDVLDTGEGRAELLLGPEALLWVDHHTRIHFDDTRLENTLLVLEAGSVLVEVRSTKGDHHLQASAGGVTAGFPKDGVYRVEAGAPPLQTGLRVYAGEAELSSGETLHSGERVAFGGTPDVVKFDRKQFDDFYYWTAYRSFYLQAEGNARAGDWRRRGRQGVTNTDFGIKFPLNSSAAWLQYLTATRAGTLYYGEGDVVLKEPGDDLPSSRLPRPLKAGGLVSTRRGRAELLLGPGVTLRIVENSTVRLVDDHVDGPVVALQDGKTMIEVSKAGRDAGVRVQVGEFETELAKAGLYEFDGNGLRVYGGEARTRVADELVKTKSEERLDWSAPEKAAKFDADDKDALFRWSALRSFALFRYGGDLMSDWDTRGFGNEARHPQFGSQSYRGGRRRR